MRAPFFCPYTTRSSLLPLFCRKSQQLFSIRGSLRQRAPLLLSDLVIQQLYVLQFSFAIGYNLGTIDQMAISHYYYIINTFWGKRSY